MCFHHSLLKEQVKIGNCRHHILFGIFCKFWRENWKSLEFFKKGVKYKFHNIVEFQINQFFINIKKEMLRNYIHFSKGNKQSVSQDLEIQKCSIIEILICEIIEFCHFSEFLGLHYARFLPKCHVKISIKVI